MENNTTDKETISNGKAPNWISVVSVVSSVVTIALTVINAYTKFDIDKTDQRLKDKEYELEKEFKKKIASLEELKEKTSRYTFIKTLFQELESNNAKKQTLTINLIRLTLTEDEAGKFFRGFTNSENKELQKVGNEAIAVIEKEKKEKSSAELATEKEREGFLYLLDDNFNDALISFETAKEAFPTYHNVDEIASLLKKERTNFSRPDIRKSILSRIIKEYSWGMPDDIYNKLRKKAGV